MDLAEAEQLLREAGRAPDRSLDLLAVAGAFALFDLGELSEPVALTPYRRHLDDMAQAIQRRLPDGGSQAGLKDRLEAMRQVMFVDEGYAGDTETYDSLLNANIMSVIERRRGLPVALGLICMALADRLGWQMAGLNFPGHFLLRFTVGREQAVIDPFAGLSERQPGELRLLIKAHRGPEAELEPQHELPVTRRAVLMRLRNNTKVRLMESEDDAAALTCVSQMQWLDPDDVDLMREAAILNIRLGNLGGAIGALSDIAGAETDPQAAAEAASMASELKRKLN